MNFSVQSLKDRQRGAFALLILIAFVISIASPRQARAVDLPDGFSETTVATDIQNPVGMEVSPDGRIFVLAGNVKRIEVFDDSGFLNNFIELPQVLNRGSGLLGLDFAPDFETSGDVYIAYVTDPGTVPGPQRFRLSRFSSDGTVASNDSEVVIFEVEDIDPTQQLHQGGDLVVGADDKIYWALGDRVKGSEVSQPLDSLFGKLLRLDLDGSIPADNPFYADLDGDLRAIYANGLRNPFRMEKRKTTGEIYMSEVGPVDWEEVNKAESGANYGWPLFSGVANDPAYTDPVHAYPHDPDGCAITGGAFYEPRMNQFPFVYHDKFFYGDHCFGWIAHVDPGTGVDTRFMAGANRLVEIKINPATGALYYLDREYAGDSTGRTGGIGRIDYVGKLASFDITRQPSSTTASIGEDVSFDVLVTGTPPFSFQWFKDGAPLIGETASSLSVRSVQAEDNQSEFFVEIGDTTGFSMRSDTAVLTVSANNTPVARILRPDPAAFLYIAGEEVPFSGIASDVEDGALDASAFRWDVVFHHGNHTHPFITDVRGIKEGTFVPPANDETAPNVWYRIHLTVTDSAGTSTSVRQDVFPLLTDVSVRTEPPGLKLLIDGTPRNAPIGFKGVAGVARVLEAPETQLVDGKTWTFSSWSNGGNRTQTLSTPLFATTYVANYDSGDTGDLPPAAGLTSPSAGSTESTPVTVAGIASGSGGVKRVQLVIQDLGTKDYWNGSSFSPGWRKFNARLDNPGSPVTSWSYRFSPPNDVEVRVVAKAWQTDGVSGDKERVVFDVVADGAAPVEPTVTINSPGHGASVVGPVTIEGSVEMNNLNAVKLVIKEVGARNYWNGAEWLSTRSRVDATLSGGLWSYVLAQPVPRDVVVQAIALDGNGTRVVSNRVKIFIE